jgi:hypothetical protein
MGQPRRERSAAQAWPLCICTQEQGLGRNRCGNCFDLVCKSYYISCVRIAETLLSLVEEPCTIVDSFHHYSMLNCFPDLEPRQVIFYRPWSWLTTVHSRVTLDHLVLLPITHIWWNCEYDKVFHMCLNIPNFSAIAFKQTSGHKDFLKSWIWSRLWRGTQARDHTNR